LVAEGFPLTNRSLSHGQNEKRRVPHRLGRARHFINNDRSERTWANRGAYRRGYPGIHPYAVSNRVEHPEQIRRGAEERAAARGGHAFHEEHRRH
jgi:hypothetical protein